MSRSIAPLTAVFLALTAVMASADIYQWEYINPADPSQGRQQSMTLCPDGAGQNAAPYAYIYGDLTMAYLAGANLRNAWAGYSDMSFADLSQANLTGAGLYNATLNGADFTGAQVKGASFESSDLTPAQLYSTASYQAHDLTGIGFALKDVSGWNLADQNLSGANLNHTTLTGTNLRQANLSGVYADTSILTNANLAQANLSNARFYYATFTNAILTQANLSNAFFYDANLSGADLTGAEIRGARFGGINTISVAQLYSTASYQAHDLADTALGNSNLAGANFAAQNLTNTDFNSATLTNASFAGAVVQGAVFAGATGFTAAQLYSTASYQAHDLARINFGTNYPTPPLNLSGWNFSGQNLYSARFTSAGLGGANFSQANLENSDFSFAGLSNANLSQADLKNVNFYQAGLDGTNFAGADVRGAQFTPSYGFSHAQLYSTGSYQTHDLTGIGLAHMGLGGANFVGQNLTNAWMYNADLSGANLSQANLTNVNFDWAKFTGANFSGAEIRGAIFTPNFFGGGLTLAQLYTTGSYLAHDLTGVNFNSLDFSGGNFVGQNLTDAVFSNVAGADFTGAIVRGAAIGGITLPQLYTTASYQAHDLSGIKFFGADLTGADFSGQNLTGASFGSATLTGADFSGAEVRGASFTLGCGPCGVTISLPQLYSTASYQAHDLSGINFFGSDLTGADFSGQNLTNTSLYGTILIGADFSGATIRGASLSFTTQAVQGFTASQLYSTASYQAHDLTGVDLGGGNDLSGWNFAGQNLTDSRFGGATLTDAVFTGANLTNAWLDQGVLTGADFSYANLAGARFYSSMTEGGTNFSHANLQNAQMDFYYENHNSIPVNFTGADARGAQYLNVYGELDFVVTNFIRHDGYVGGLDLDAGQRLLVRDYDGGTDPFGEPVAPISIAVDQHLTMGPGGTLQMVFEGDDWGSTISFETGIPVTLGGRLELNFAEGVDLASQVGRTLDLFDWTGVSPSGTFAVDSLYFWDLSNLYSAGDVIFLAVGLGDFNDDRLYNCDDVDPLVAAIAGGTNPTAFDLTNDGLVNIADLDAWRAEAGAVNIGLGRVYLPGDATLDGAVDGSDFGIWNSHKFTNVAAWCSGDFSADGAVDGSDFGTWNAHKFTSSDSASSIPEPTGTPLVLVGVFVLASRRRSRRPEVSAAF